MRRTPWTPSWRAAGRWTSRALSMAHRAFSSLPRALRARVRSRVGLRRLVKLVEEEFGLEVDMKVGCGRGRGRPTIVIPHRMPGHGRQGGPLGRGRAELRQVQEAALDCNLTRAGTTSQAAGGERVGIGASGVASGLGQDTGASPRRVRCTDRPRPIGLSTYLDMTLRR